MLATIINVTLILAGSVLGLLFRNLISKKLLAIMFQALGLCVLGIGISNMVGTANMLCVIVSMVIGTVIGNAIDIERHLDRGGDLLRAKVLKGNGDSRFAEGFVNATLLFCVGAMAITGSIEAGLNHNYRILISKGVIDGVTAISFAAAMGPGVVFSAVPVLLYQGLITLLSGLARPLLSAAVITEMSAVGGTLIAAIAINMLDLGKTRIKVGNMLPAIILPILYLPFADWLSGLFSAFL